MPIRIVPIVPLSQLAASVARINSQFPTVKQNILREASKVFVDDAKSKVHVISGRTRSSIRMSRVDSNGAEIEARFGAIAEIRRGGSKPPPFRGMGSGPHNFLISATDATTRQFPNIVKKHINNLFQIS